MKHSTNAEYLMYREVAILRELYGVLQVLATRPLSDGNQLALIEARNAVVNLLGTLENHSSGLLGQSVLASMRLIADRIDELRPDTVGRLLVSSIQRALASVRYEHEDAPLCCHALPKVDSMRRMLVQVGPTIGVGDELLMARALMERNRCLGGPPPAVSSARPDLWHVLGEKFEPLGPPPLGALRYIEDASPQERSALSVLFLDFMRSDPNRNLYTGPPGIASAARWFMGSKEVETFDFEHQLRYFHKPLPGMPSSRWLESRYLAACAIPGRDDISDVTLASGMWLPPASHEEGPIRIALQLLTSKPTLMLSGGWYAQVFADLRRLTSRPIDLHILPAPTPDGQTKLDGILEQIQRSLSDAAIHTYASTDLTGIMQILSKCHLLFGPDTFSAHMAAIVGIPQVTLTLPVHLGWSSIGAPIFVVPVTGMDNPTTARDSARRLALFAELRRNPGDFLTPGRRWRQAASELDNAFLGYLYGARVDPSTLENAIKTLQYLYLTHRDEIGYRLSLCYDEEIPAFCRFDLSPYSNTVDAWLGAMRFYQSIAITSVSAVLTAACAFVKKPQLKVEREHAGLV